MENISESKNKSILFMEDSFKSNTKLFTENKKKNSYKRKIKYNECYDKSSFNIRNCYVKLDISVLEAFNKINLGIIDQLKNYNINNIKELSEYLNNSDIKITSLGTGKINRMKDALEKLEMNTEELFKYLINEIKSKPEYEVVKSRIIGNKTLQEIANESGITRERVRQKELKVIKKIEALLKIYININNIEKIQLLKIEDILEIRSLNEEERKILINTLKNIDSEKFEYIEEINKFLVNGDLEKVRLDIDESFKALSQISKIDYDLLYKLNNNESIMLFSLDEIISIVGSLGYVKVNSYLIRGNESKTKLYNFIVKEFFKSGITFSNKEEIKKFNSILRENFGVEEERIRNIKARIENYCILCNRGSYIHPDLISIEEKLINKIKRYIDNNNSESLYINEIYLKFKNDLNKQGINNRYYLQGILKYYLGESYKFTKDIIFTGDKKQHKNYMFNKYLEEAGRIVTREEIEEKFAGWTPVMISNAIEECKYVLKWDKGFLIHANLIKTSLYDINEIKNILYEKFSNGRESITDNEAFFMLKDKFNKLFEDNNIDNTFKLFSILEYILSNEYYFRRPYILKNKPEELVSGAFILKKLFNDKNKLTLTELKEFCNDIQLNERTKNKSINELLKNTIEIEKETYILKENFKINKDSIVKIKNILMKKVKYKGYIAINNIEDFSEFPCIEYAWNKYLIRDICKNYILEFKELKRQFYDKRYYYPILVKVTSNVENLSELITYIVYIEFNGTVSLNELSKYLRESNIIHERIPCEIYNCNSLLIENNIVKVIYENEKINA